MTKNTVVDILDRAGMIGDPEPEPTTMKQRLDQYTFPTYRQCAYPRGAPCEPGFSWCMAPVKPDSSFCPEHHALCYIDERVARKKDDSIETADLTQQRSRRNAAPMV